MFKIILFSLIITFSFSTIFAQDVADNVSRAKTFVELLAKKDFSATETYFSDEVKAKLSAAKLEEVWNSLTPQVGNFKRQAAIKSLRQPILILQGERDYQVTLTDFQSWKSAQTDKRNVTFKSYPQLNHLFMTSEGTPSPEDYKKTRHVSAEVIGDIADWILKAKKK